MQEVPHLADPGFPALLRAARNTYAMAVRQALEAAGFDDLPRQAPYLIGAIARRGAPLSEIIRQLRVSKQVGGQLVDVLVVRGYLNREVDPQDRRRLTISLTERGQEAALAIRQAVERVDGEIAALLPRPHIEHSKAVLAAIAELGERLLE